MISHIFTGKIKSFLLHVICDFWWHMSLLAWTVGYIARDPQVDTLTQAHRHTSRDTHRHMHKHRHKEMRTQRHTRNTYKYSSLYYSSAYMSLQVNTMIPRARFHGLYLSARDSRTQYTLTGSYS